MSKRSFTRSLSKKGPSLYEILEVSETATQDEIKTNYKRLATMYDPLKNSNKPERKETLMKIRGAYRVLKDEKKRSLYDQYGDVALAMGHTFGAENITKHCKTIDSNPCLKFLFCFCNILTCCYCCFCCCFCCFCCGRFKEFCEMTDFDLIDDEDDPPSPQPNKQADTPSSS